MALENTPVESKVFMNNTVSLLSFPYTQSPPKPPKPHKLHLNVHTSFICVLLHDVCDAYRKINTYIINTQ